ncbi:MAG: dihydrofolate reductase family protein [Patulibacter minatonensis]
MRKLVYYVGSTIDGAIAGPDDEIDFFPSGPEVLGWIAEEYPETLPAPVRAGMGIDAAPNRAFDTVLMGRETYRPALGAGLTSPYPHLRQIVASASLPELDPAIERTTDALATVRALKREDGLDLWLCGGSRLAGALLPEVDRIVVKRYPVVAGGGRPMLEGGFSPAAFTRAQTIGFDDGTAVTTFDRAG